MELLVRGESSVLIDIFARLGSAFLLENPKVYDLQVGDEYDEKQLPEKLSYHSPIPLNEEQQKIIMALRNPGVRNVIVEGPPGTGKSHTITAIIFNALLEHKTVLMTSDKKEALDVVEDKITDTLDKIKKEDDFLQNPLLRLGKKETNYSKIFKRQNYEKINSRYTAGKHHFERLNQEIEKCTKTIKENIDNEVDVHSSVDLELIQNIFLKEDAIKDKYGKVIDFAEAYGSKGFVKFIKELRTIIAEFRGAETVIDSTENNIDYDVLAMDGQHTYEDIHENIPLLLVCLDAIDLKEIDIVREDAEFLETLERIPSRFPVSQLEKLIELHAEIDNQLKMYQDLFGKIYVDYEEASRHLALFDKLLNETEDVCNLLKRLIQFYRDNFVKGKRKLLLINDINDDNVSEVGKYIKTVLSLRSKILGLVLKRSRLREVNHEFLNEFPSWSTKRPHRGVGQLETEYRFYSMVLDAKKSLKGCYAIDKQFLSWAGLESLVTGLHGFDLDKAFAALQTALSNFMKELDVLRAASYFSELPDNYAFSSIDDYKRLMVVNRYIGSYRDISAIVEQLHNEGVMVSPGSPLTIHSLLKVDNIKRLIGIGAELEKVIGFYSARRELLKEVNDFKNTFRKTVEKMKIDGNMPRTMIHNRLCNFADKDIREVCDYLDKYHSVKDNYDRLRISHYGKERLDLEMKLALKMTHILDRAVVEYRNERLSDQQKIRDLIRKKKRIPKELLRGLVKAFPCLIVNLRDLGEYLPLEPEVFDIVIIDEASQVSIAQAFPAILRGKKVVVFGDKRQYSNVKSHNASKATNNFLFSQVKETYENYISGHSKEQQQVLANDIDMFDIKKSILDFLLRVANYTCSLRKHFRGYMEIIGYSNETFYNRWLQVMKIRSKPIDTVLNFHILRDAEQIDVYRNVNSHECEFIINKLEELKEKGQKESVGIITPFTNQQRYIYGQLLSHEDSDYFFDVMKLKVMTFDTCQGDEKDIIFYSFVERGDENILRWIFPKNLSALDDEEEGTIKGQRLNVGFSRAKEEMHFVLSKDIANISGEIGRALNFYHRELRDAEKLPSMGKCDSEMEKFLLSCIEQTAFYQEHKKDIEIHSQFEIGKYLRQIYDDIEIPKYRTDFLLVFRGKSGKTCDVIIEYDGFEFHFKEGDGIGIENYDQFFVKKDIERQKTLESYGYSFIRLNKFLVRDDPVGFLDRQLSEIVKTKGSDGFVGQVVDDAGKIEEGTLKKCPRCGLLKDLAEFLDRNTKSGIGRYCRECKPNKGDRVKMGVQLLETE